MSLKLNITSIYPHIIKPAEPEYEIPAKNLCKFEELEQKISTILYYALGLKFNNHNLLF